MSEVPNLDTVVVDTSAIVAILKDEPEAEHFRQILVDIPLALISAATWTELMIVTLMAGGSQLVVECQGLLHELGIEPSPMQAADADEAFDAYRRYGRGTGHGAKLNFGDCFSYALAKSLGKDLLYKGDDFPQTDIRAATWRNPS